MRVRVGISCTAITCAGAGAAIGVVGCFSNSSAGPGTQPTFDASVDSSFPMEDSSADTFVPPVEAAVDSGVDSTVAPVDAGKDSAPEAGCSPIAITGFTVPPYVHAQFQNILCQNSQDAWFAQQCFGTGATLESCAAFATSAPADAGPDAEPVIGIGSCSACLVTPADSDAGYGPGVAGTIVTPNVAGCIELTDESAMGLACAEAVQAAADCVDYACRTSCPVVTTDVARAEYLACTQVAATGVCNTYTQAAQACIATEIGDGGNSNVEQWCFSSSDPATQYAQLALYFCSS
jgi:hypothetical protein